MHQKISPMMFLRERPNEPYGYDSAGNVTSPNKATDLRLERAVGQQISLQQHTMTAQYFVLDLIPIRGV